MTGMEQSNHKKLGQRLDEVRSLTIGQQKVWYLCTHWPGVRLPTRTHLVLQHHMYALA